ncbi:hypothetical protein [Blautia sp. LMAG:75]|uniref:hypothetical protein n=1 Tax=Blautia sp. LMAG:75 TaxID=1969171 RepID=UPI002ED47DD2
MLTRRQNLLETIRGGHPDRYVNQYEALGMIFGNPYTAASPNPEYGKPPIKNAWGRYHGMAGRNSRRIPDSRRRTYCLQRYYTLERLCKSTASGLFRC